MPSGGFNGVVQGAQQCRTLIYDAATFSAWIRMTHSKHQLAAIVNPRLNPKHLELSGLRSGSVLKAGAP